MGPRPSTMAVDQLAVAPHGRAGVSHPPPQPSRRGPVPGTSGAQARPARWASHATQALASRPDVQTRAWGWAPSSLPPSPRTGPPFLPGMRKMIPPRLPCRSRVGARLAPRCRRAARSARRGGRSSHASHRAAGGAAPQGVAPTASPRRAHTTARPAGHGWRTKPPHAAVRASPHGRPCQPPSGRAAPPRALLPRPSRAFSPRQRDTPPGPPERQTPDDGCGGSGPACALGPSSRRAAPGPPARADCAQAMAPRAPSPPACPWWAARPGAGAVCAPRLLGACGAQRERSAAAAALPKEAGSAPGTDRRGTTTGGPWRWPCPPCLRHTCVAGAAASLRQACWARPASPPQRDQGPAPQAAVQARACTGRRLLLRGWQERTPSAASVSLKALQRRGSPRLRNLAHSV
jgi:hypothetical protein